MTTGDLIKVTLGSNTRRFTVPTLTMTIDRVANVVTGLAPAGTVVHLDRPYTADVAVGSDGRWSYEASNDFNGNNLFFIHWSNTRGDRVNLVQFAPQLFLTLGESRFQAFAHPRSTATITLTRETATGQRVAAMDEAFGRYGEIWDNFRDQSGRRMRVHAGDHVSAPLLAADADWIVPNIEGRGNALNNVVRGRCHDAGTSLGWYHAAVLDARTEQAKGSVWGWVDADGNFSVDFDDPASGTGVAYHTTTADVVSGDRIDVWCEQVTGDFVVAHFIV